MLYLNPPYLVVDGVTIFTDHADPLQLYYLPLSPHFATTRQDDGLEIPRFLLVKYRGTAGKGGFLSFDTSLGISNDRLAKVAAKAKDMLRIVGDPRLSPVPFIDGTVQMQLFGKQSDLPTPTGQPPRPTPAPSGPTAPPASPVNVLKMVSSARPSLYGDEEAAFSVALDQGGVTVMEQCLAGEIVPLSVVYSLSFTGLRPAYNVKAHVDWKRVQKHLQESFGVSLVVFGASIDKIVDELVEQGDRHRGRHVRDGRR